MESRLISLSIMAHPARSGWVDALRGELGDVPVGWDDEGPPRRDHDRVWRTARRAWNLYDRNAQWHLVLQDDALPVPGLLGHLQRALERVPERAMVNLYMGAQRPMSGLWTGLIRRADDAGASWVVGPMSMWGVATVLPTSLIPEMIAGCDALHGLPDDQRIGRWCARFKVPCWYPWPSLVDHRDEGSLLGHGPGRVARAVGVGHDWGGPVITHGRL